MLILPIRKLAAHFLSLPVAHPSMAYLLMHEEKLLRENEYCIVYNNQRSNRWDHGRPRYHRSRSLLLFINK